MVSVTTSQLWGYGFHSELGLISVWNFSASPSAKKILQNGVLSRGVFSCLPASQCFWDRLQIDSDPDQDKAVTDNEHKSYVKMHKPT